MSSLKHGLVGHWTMNHYQGDEVKDSSAYSNHGTMVNNPQIVDGLIGGDGAHALTFDGEDEYTSIPDDDALLFDSSSSFTVSLWIDFQASGGRIFNKTVSSPYLSFGSYHYDDGRILWAVDEGSGSMDDVFCAESALTGVHNVIYTYDDGTRSLFIDGEELSDDDCYSGGLSNSGDGQLYFGQRGDDSQFLNTVIDDFRIYDRALFPLEIKQLYNMRNLQQVYV